MPYLLPFGASFLFVALKSAQQLNVMRSLYWWIPPTSLLMAVAEVFVIGQVAVQGWNPILVIAVGSGSGLGSVAATWLHNHYSQGAGA